MCVDLSDLSDACDQSDLSLVKRLLKSGARVNVADQQHSLPIHYATRRGCAAIVKELLDHGMLFNSLFLGL